MLELSIEGRQSPSLLAGLEHPEQLRSLDSDELAQLAQEMRQEIIETVALRGGHLASNLGTIELTLALHLAFDTPRDRLVWDIGHQAYPHKLVTGRRSRFRTLKQWGGISGYLRRDESEFDAFGASHASTSISAALGMAMARDLQGEDYHVVAIIGDGALTGGMALEALNHAGFLQKRLIVILNDNHKSISDNVGALHTYFGRLRTNERYRHQSGQLSQRRSIAPTIFEELGFTFLGLVDGHNIQSMIEVFQEAQEVDGPVLIQVLTQKGQGCDFALADPTTFHGPGAYDPATGRLKNSVGALPKYQDVFASTLVELAQRDPAIIGITAAMAEGTSLSRLQRAIPERFVDVGICEQHAVTLAAGLACEGMRPVVAIYSTFLQRAFDQVIHDVGVQNLPVVFCMDRAGIVGEDGQTQHGVFDIGYLRMIPSMHVMAPKDENELRHMLYTALSLDGPVALRYPRGAGVGVPLDPQLHRLPVGKAEILTPEIGENAACAILAYGHMVQAAVEAGQEIRERDHLPTVVVNARWAKPLDEELILRLARSTRCLVTVEDHVVSCGFGSAVTELLHARGLHDVCVYTIGLPDRFVEHGTAAMLRERYGLSARRIREVVCQHFQQACASEGEIEPCVTTK
jgi:1-deoxy-D-xylulose-5-phosphate synthase